MRQAAQVRCGLLTSKGQPTRTARLLWTLCLKGSQVIKTVFAWVYALILGFIFFERVKVMVPIYRAPDILTSVIAFSFFASYVVYLINKKMSILVFSFISLCIYAVLKVVWSYKYPLLTRQEYLVTSAFYLIVSIPMFVGLLRKFVKVGSVQN